MECVETSVAPNRTTGGTPPTGRQSIQEGIVPGWEQGIDRPGDVRLARQGVGEQGSPPVEVFSP